jgi:hypothetical protein
MAFVALAPFYSVIPFASLGTIIFWLVTHSLQNIKGIVSVLLFRTQRPQSLTAAGFRVGRSEAVDSSMDPLPPSTRNFSDQSLDSES